MNIKKAATVKKAKSEAALPQFMERVRALHSYEVPCVVAMPIAAGYQPFLQWIAENSLPHTA